MGKVLEYRNCFVCGKESANGLKVDFSVTGDGAQAVYTPGHQFEGFKGVVHGGILCALLDEIMWKAINGKYGSITMTAKMEVRFKKPALTGAELQIEGTVQGRKRNFFEARGIIRDREGNTVAEASGLFMEPDGESSALMAGYLE